MYRYVLLCMCVSFHKTQKTVSCASQSNGESLIALDRSLSLDILDQLNVRPSFSLCNSPVPSFDIDADEKISSSPVKSRKKKPVSRLSHLDYLSSRHRQVAHLTPCDLHPNLSDHDPDYPIVFLATNVSWSDQWLLLKQAFPTAFKQSESAQYPLTWFAFDIRQGQRKLIGVLFATAYQLNDPTSIFRASRSRAQSRLGALHSTLLCSSSSNHFYRQITRPCRSQSSRRDKEIPVTNAEKFLWIEPSVESIDNPFVFINWLVVDSDYRGKDVGSRLLDRLETYAWDWRVQFVQLQALPEAYSTYRKRGYFQAPNGYWYKQNPSSHTWRKSSRLPADVYPWRAPLSKYRLADRPPANCPTHKRHLYIRRRRR